MNQALIVGDLKDGFALEGDKSEEEQKKAKNEEIGDRECICDFDSATIDLRGPHGKDL